ncbi:hypothetical protein IWW50_003195 [Coemansia erecta]|nr:hypothetical protein GGF43_005102 [Coemansia sp. RSA 2618]KAJ2824719.1 hypothetical protein IWW50_003195 [Coemansia erecta]
MRGTGGGGGKGGKGRVGNTAADDVIEKQRLDSPWPLVGQQPPVQPAGEEVADNWPVAVVNSDDGGLSEVASESVPSVVVPETIVHRPVEKQRGARRAARKAVPAVTSTQAAKTIAAAKTMVTARTMTTAALPQSTAPSAMNTAALSVVTKAVPSILTPAAPSVAAPAMSTASAPSLEVAAPPSLEVSANSGNTTSGNPGVNGVMRMAASSTDPARDVLDNIRNSPSSGSGMGYHGHRLVRGVNIGGFLVPEFWITPSLVDGIAGEKPGDYLALCRRLGAEATLALMRRHWETWVTEPEIQRLAGAGLTHLRVPVGHWEFVDSGEGYVRGGLPYFKRLVYWAHKHGLQVIADMHTAPGSQNGFDNSGSTDGVHWTSDPKNVALSKRALQTMLKYIASDPVVLATVDAIDLLNEPLIDLLDFEQLWEYDTGGHTLVTQGLHKTPPVVSVVDRGFKDFSWWHARWPRDWNSKYIDAWLDAHLYHVFDRNIDEWPLESHLKLVCQNGRDLKSNSTVFPILVGEWSLALPQAALSGRENEARRRFAEAQLDAYELGGAGWVFWCFKTEASPEWSFLDALDRSWIPQPLNTREFPSICHY